MNANAPNSGKNDGRIYSVLSILPLVVALASAIGFLILRTVGEGFAGPHPVLEIIRNSSMVVPVLIVLLAAIGMFFSGMALGRKEAWFPIALLGTFGNLGTLVVVAGLGILAAQFPRDPGPSQLVAQAPGLAASSAPSENSSEQGEEWIPTTSPTPVSPSVLGKISGSGKFMGPFFILNVYNGNPVWITDVEARVEVRDNAGSLILDRVYIIPGVVPPFSGSELNVHSGMEFENLGPDGAHLADTCKWKILRAKGMVPPGAGAPDPSRNKPQ